MWNQNILATNLEKSDVAWRQFDWCVIRTTDDHIFAISLFVEHMRFYHDVLYYVIVKDHNLLHCRIDLP